MKKFLKTVMNGMLLKRVFTLTTCALSKVFSVWETAGWDSVAILRKHIAVTRYKVLIWQVFHIWTRLVWDGGKTDIPTISPVYRMRPIGVALL
jgi:hypothetical protein